MITVDLNLCLKISDAIVLVIYKYSYFLSTFVLVLFCINILLYCDAGNHKETLYELWKLTTLIYILILYIGLVGVPITVILEYIEEVCVSKLDLTVVITVWMYTFWIGIFSKCLILAFLNILVGILMPQEINIMMDEENLQIKPPQHAHSSSHFL